MSDPAAGSRVRVVKCLCRCRVKMQLRLKSVCDIRKLQTAEQFEGLLLYRYEQSYELQPVRSNRKFERHFATATSSSFWLWGRTAVLRVLRFIWYLQIEQPSARSASAFYLRLSPVHAPGLHGFMLGPVPATNLEACLGSVTCL